MSWGVILVFGCGVAAAIILILAVCGAASQGDDELERAAAERRVRDLAGRQRDDLDWLDRMALQIEEIRSLPEARR
jgi:hypothetical protein